MSSGMLRRWLDPLRYRFGTWRREMRRRWNARVRRIAEPRAASQVSVSVVVPVKNAGPDLRDLVVRMKGQHGFRAVEVVIVDSGSTDGSAELAESLGATVVRIAPEEFSHSHARNLGAERASGDYVLFTVQDALPSSERWLLAMFEALQRHQAAAVSCGEEPRPDSDLFYRAISWNHDRFMSAGGRDVVLFRSSDDSPMERRRGAQISDTACLVRRDVFLRYRHRGNYAEDLDLGLRLTADGYRLVYLSSPRIIHSHNRPAYYHLRRAYVEYLALFDMLPGFPPVAGSMEFVTRDIVASAAALDRLVAGPLQALTAPCAPAQVREAVSAGLRATGAPLPGRDYLDARTRAFVERLPAPAADGAAGDDSVSLTDGLEGIAGLLCAYLAATSQVLDANLIEDFKAGLYKSWAQHCGVRLASVYWRGPEGVREAMRPIHDELTREV